MFVDIGDPVFTAERDLNSIFIPEETKPENVELKQVGIQRAYGFFVWFETHLNFLQPSLKIKVIIRPI